MRAVSLPAAARSAPVRIRHEARLRTLEVVRAETLTPRMRRIVLGGEALDGFVSAAADDHVKLFLPAPGQDRPILPGMGPNGPVFPQNAVRPIARDYTPRRFDADARELTIDFVLHGDGPATSWAAQARAGQMVGIGGPRGSLLIADDFDCYLLVGDETALPAIGRRLEELPSGARAIVLVEVAGGEEERYLRHAASLADATSLTGFAGRPSTGGHSVRWLTRNDAHAGDAEPLLGALRDLDWPSGDIHAWMAGESGVIRRLRSHLAVERGLPRDRIRAAGYWKAGDAASHERIEEEP